MDQNEIYYRKMMRAIAFTMLIFVGMITLFGELLALFSGLMSYFPIPHDVFNLIYQLFYGAGYLACFLLPIPFLRLFVKNAGHSYQPVYAQPRMTPYFPLILFAGVALIIAASFVNAFFAQFVDFSSLLPPQYTESMEDMAPYQMVLQFIVMCLIPGVCEELLFRGAILTNCLPFGRHKAILISALLFGLMHQNVAQIFYAFVAGILLGLVYEYTGSIWNCILLHTLNNFVSLFSSLLLFKLGEGSVGYTAMMILELVVFLLGAVSLVILITKCFSKRYDFKDGVFGKTHLAADHYATSPISSAATVKHFLNVPMIIFLILCAVQMIWVILSPLVIRLLYDLLGI